ncbi:peroxiredoxin [Castellaniella sp.]|uniref:peroxiredoxin n=1 Tax=Castellaniella sp. TaxID=1955812 RepID=UPI003568D97D
MSLPIVGQPIPRLTGPSTQGPFDSAQLAGKPYVLYFYPRDNTPGCTTEAQDFRDLHGQFLAHGCAVFGVSRDSLKSHERFAEKQSLPFALISDPDEALCTLFGVMKNKTLYGKPVRGIERSTFLVDAAGQLAREWRGVRVPDHAAEVLQAVQALGT